MKYKPNSFFFLLQHFDIFFFLTQILTEYWGSKIICNIRIRKVFSECEEWERLNPFLSGGSFHQTSWVLFAYFNNCIIYLINISVYFFFKVGKPYHSLSFPV